MPLRPGRCYRRFGTPPYTRTEYIKSLPPVQVAKFDLGNPKGQFDTVLKLISLENGQIRMNAIEAARRVANKYLSSKIGDENYHLKILTYPHHIIRENKMMAMAGADRLQDGMRLSFGTPIGRAARIKNFQVIMFIRTNKENISIAKEALRRASSKISLSARIVIK